MDFYCYKELAESTHKTYKAGLRRSLNFCCMRDATPFPVSESLLCYFVAALARQGLAPSTIKTYLASVRHAQIVRGLSEPREHSNLSRLRPVQAGVQRARVEQGHTRVRQRLPVTPAHLRLVHGVWNHHAPDPDIVMLWATATVCFFRFFRSGKITMHIIQEYTFLGVMSQLIITPPPP